LSATAVTTTRPARPDRLSELQTTSGSRQIRKFPLGYGPDRLIRNRLAKCEAAEEDHAERSDAASDDRWPYERELIALPASLANLSIRGSAKAEHGGAHLCSGADASARSRCGRRARSPRHLDGKVRSCPRAPPTTLPEAEMSTAELDPIFRTGSVWCSRREGVGVVVSFVLDRGQVAKG
jgi:hypothetical protein